MSLTSLISLLPSYQRGQDRRELEQQRKLNEQRMQQQLANEPKLIELQRAEEIAREKRAHDEATNKQMDKWSEDMTALTTTAEPTEISPGVMRPNFVTAGLKMAAAKSAPYQKSANEFSRDLGEAPTTAEQGRTGGLATIARNKNLNTTADFDTKVTEGLDPELAARHGNLGKQSGIETFLNTIDRMKAERPNIPEDVFSQHEANVGENLLRASTARENMRYGIPQKAAAGMSYKLGTETGTPEQAAELQAAEHEKAVALAKFQAMSANQQAATLELIPPAERLNPALRDAAIAKILGVSVEDPVTKLPIPTTGEDPRARINFGRGEGINQSAWGRVLIQP